MILALAPLALAQNYQIDWYVIGSGGGHSASGSYQLDGTIGQPIVGQSSSANYRIEAGFWVGAPTGPSGCDYSKGVSFRLINEVRLNSKLDSLTICG